MASTINGTSTGNGGLITTGDDSGVLQLQTNETTAVTIDASQNVGVGTASPSAKLDVRGIARVNEDNAGTKVIQLRSDWAGVGPAVQVATNDPLLFVSNGSERARIDTSGNLLVGTTSTSNASVIQTATTNAYSLQAINTAASNPYGINSKYSGAAPNSGGFEFLMCQDTSSARMYVRSNGGISNFSANNTNLSDRREKMNFAPAKSYLDVICAIPVQTYNYIDQNLEEDDGLTLGVVAQDVQAVAPELVTESDWSAEKDGSKMRLSIYQTDMQYALMKCIQEQQALITTLTERITALEAK